MPIKLNGTTIIDETNLANTNLDNLSSTGKSLAASLGMPAMDDNNWVPLTLGASGAIYTMPEDGLVCFGANGGTIGGYIHLYCGKCASIHLASQTYEVLLTFLFVPKGYQFGQAYANAGTLVSFGYYKLIANAN